ncbi:hypothetical protein M8J76_001787 [Diaphorina citri]|nr:hypothetical protein M8J76_001787 [Diaphorina citri]
MTFSILKEESSDLLFHLALKHLFPTCLSHVPIDSWESVVLKDSLTTVSLNLTKLLSQLDVQISHLPDDTGNNMVTMNILNLIQASSFNLLSKGSCDNILGPINSLLESTLCQYHLVGSKLPSILLCIPDIMLSVCNHCANNKTKYENDCNESVTNGLKKLYSNNKLIQTSYLSLLEDKMDFSSSQETEVLEESLNKLSKLASVLLKLDVYSAYSAFKTYCSLSIKYANNLNTTLYVTPAVHAMASQVTQYIDGFCETNTSQPDPQQTKKIKLFRAFIKLILDLVEKYRGSLRDTHTTLVSLLVSMYDFTCHTPGDTGTLVEAAANNLVTCCYQDPYFINELLRSDGTSLGFISLCVMVMKKSLEVQPVDSPYDENKLALIQLVIRSMSKLEVKHFLSMLHSPHYKQTVSTLSVLSLTLSPPDYSQLESLLLLHLLSTTPSSLFCMDVWCILLHSGPKGMFETTCVFLVQYLTALGEGTYNFQYLCVMQMLRRCLASVKTGCVKKMFANGTLSYVKYPVLLSIAPQYLSSIQHEPPSTISSHNTSSKLLNSLLSSSLEGSTVIETVQAMCWEDSSTDYVVQILCAVLQANLVQFNQSSLSQLFQCIVNILSTSDDPHIWLNLLKILGSTPTPSTRLDRTITEALFYSISCFMNILSTCDDPHIWLNLLKILGSTPTPSTPLDRTITEALFTTILSRVNENSEDYMNKAITNVEAAIVHLDKSVFLKVLKSLGKVDLVSKYLSEHNIYDNLTHLGSKFQMKCSCATPQDGDTEMKQLGKDNKTVNGNTMLNSQGSSSNGTSSETYSSESDSPNPVELKVDDKYPNVSQPKPSSDTKETNLDIKSENGQLNQSTTENTKQNLDQPLQNFNQTTTVSISRDTQSMDRTNTDTAVTRDITEAGTLLNNLNTDDSEESIPSQSKRIRLEETVRINEDIERRLNELEMVLRYLNEKKTMMNDSNRKRQSSLFVLNRQSSLFVLNRQSSLFVLNRQSSLFVLNR